MKISIDSSHDSLDEVMRVVGAVYGVTVNVDRGESAVAAAPTPVSRSATSRKKVAASTRRRGRGTAAVVPTSSELRAWAKREGMVIADRGRIPQSVLDAWSTGSAKTKK